MENLNLHQEANKSCVTKEGTSKNKDHKTQMKLILLRTFKFRRRRRKFLSGLRLGSRVTTKN